MVSVKERARLAMLFEKQAQAVDRQRGAITRLLAIQIEHRAALEEIAAMEDVSEDQQHAACVRAREALQRTEEMAAASEEEARELLGFESPTTDEELRDD